LQFVVNAVKRNYYRDSIQLMRLTEEAKRLEGVIDAVVAMGTETNKLLLEQLGLLTEEGRRATEEDMVLAVKASGEDSARALLSRLESLLLSPTQTVKAGERTYSSIEGALSDMPGANLALVSVPGWQAGGVAMNLLKRGINVHLFSDHVPVEQEVELKEYARKNGLLLLGPGAGTSIINGVGLGFANVVKRGKVGIVASAGTGLQEVSVLLDAAGVGISHALGVGGSDVSSRVGGIMTLECVRLLEEDSSTSLIVIIAKKPEESVMKSVMGYVMRNTTKPVVACFLGFSSSSTGHVRHASTLHSAAALAARLAKANPLQTQGPHGVEKEAASLRLRIKDGRRFVRGLYSGGTFAHESLLIFRELVSEPYSNTPITPSKLLHDPSRSEGNCIVDLGDEFFTEGRAHPMIDPTIRRVRLIQEASDPGVAVIMMDVVLGYGSAPDPAGAMADAVLYARRAGSSGIVYMAHVCGTQGDPQVLEEQKAKLSRAGVALYPSNAMMAATAALIVGGPDAASRLKARWRELFGE